MCWLGVGGEGTLNKVKLFLWFSNFSCHTLSGCCSLLPGFWKYCLWMVTKLAFLLGDQGWGFPVTPSCWCHTLEQNLKVYSIKIFWRGTSLVVQSLRQHDHNVGGPGLIPGQGTRSYMLQLRVRMPQLKVSCAATKTQCHQMNKNKY